MLVIILILIPIIADARMAIDIKVNLNNSDILVNANSSGFYSRVVTDEDLKLFNVTKAKFIKGMKEILDKVPDDIFLRNPTPYNDVFSKHHWDEVNLRVSIKQSKIIDILQEDVELDTHEHINNTPESTIKKRSMYKDIENRISSTWSKTGVPQNEIYTNVSIDFGYGKFKYANKWRNESTHTTKLSIGVTNDGLVTTKPGKTVVTKLIASKTIVLMKLVYEARLTGSVIASFIEPYGNHYFWASKADTIMATENMKNDVITTEILEIRCFTNPRLLVYEKVIKKKRPQMKIIRNKNATRIIYIKTKKPKKTEKILKNKI